MRKLPPVCTSIERWAKARNLRPRYFGGRVSVVDSDGHQVALIHPDSGLAFVDRRDFGTMTELDGLSLVVGTFDDLI